MAAGVACGLQNRYGVRTASRVGSTPTRSRQLSLIVGTLLLLSLAGRAAAQEPASQDTAAAVTLPASPDSSATPVASSGAPTTTSDSPGPPVSPMGAFFRSLVLPGWGQASVGRPVRGAFYFAMESASLWMLFKTDAKLSSAERIGDEDLISSRKAQREDWIVMAVFWALFSGVDAWVSANMWDFEGAVVPPPDGSPGVAVQYSVPVRGFD